MNDVHRSIREEVLQRSVRTRDAESPSTSRATFRRTAQDAANLHADPAKRFHMHGADEARADDGRADLRDSSHFLFTPAALHVVLTARVIVFSTPTLGSTSGLSRLASVQGACPS